MASWLLRATPVPTAWRTGKFFVGDRRVEGPVPLRHGDLIRLGGQLLVFRLSGRTAETWTEGAARGRDA